MTDDTAPKPAPPSFHAPDEPDWHRRIAETAYFIAERRGFQTNAALDDWLEAEQRVHSALQREIGELATLGASAPALKATSRQ